MYFIEKGVDPRYKIPLPSEFRLKLLEIRTLLAFDKAIGSRLKVTIFCSGFRITFGQISGKSSPANLYPHK